MIQQKSNMQKYLRYQINLSSMCPKNILPLRKKLKSIPVTLEANSNSSNLSARSTTGLRFSKEEIYCGQDSHFLKIKSIWLHKSK